MKNNLEKRKKSKTFALRQRFVIRNKNEGEYKLNRQKM